MTDEELTALLRERLPRRTAPAALRARLERRYAKKRRASNVVVALAALAFVALVLFFARRHDVAAPSPMIAEAVNDHLRVLYAERPLEIESGGIHQVKPWFAGRVDFAPAIAFDGDADFPLQGGSVAVYIDRKAAAFVYKHKLHVITLLVFRADGLPWGRADEVVTSSRGFHVVLWRAGDLGYALVSDVAAEDLATLEQRIKAAR
ncbi:MAG TPA: hypothetical protein VGH28_00620 [Polyangiaceae bacterium]|jgi:anti-sigma factor RsiW